LRSKHGGERIEQYPSIVSRARFDNDALDQTPPDPSASHGGPHEQPLHFAALTVDVPKCHHSGWRSIDAGDEKRPGGWSIVTRQSGQFIIEMLIREVNGDPRRIFPEHRSKIGQIRG
jgi:hypothetical protein